MASSRQYFRAATSTTRRRGPSLEVLFFKMGGFTGAVRRIVSKWDRPFTANQVKVAIVRTHPELLPAQFQIEDILAVMVERGAIVQLADGSYQRPAKLQEAA